MSAPWPEERIDRLKALVARGLSAADIAAELGVTRNTVIGKLRRLGVPLHNRPTGWPHRKRQAARDKGPSITAARKGKRDRGGGLQQRMAKAWARLDAPALPAPRRPPPPMRIEDIPVPVPRDIGLMDLAPRDCRWPVNDPPRGGPYLFCGAPKAVGSYCAYHHHLSRGTGTPSERAVARLGATTAEAGA